MSSNDCRRALRLFQGMAQFEEYDLDSPESPGGDGDTPSHVAAGLSDIAPLVALLPFVTNIDVEGDIGNTPLHVAANFGQEGAARLLLAHGARLDIPNDYDETPLDMMRSSPEMAVLLSELGFIDGDGGSPEG